ncbi:hypothetical protein PW035_62040 [Nonomuraea angiospora]|nr:hypothetical protein [Nonomuraea angiospora]
MTDDYRQRCADAAVKAWNAHAVVCEHTQRVPIGSIVDAILAERDDDLEQLRAELERRVDADAVADQAAKAPGLPLWRAAERKRAEDGVGKVEWVAQIGIGRRSYDRLALQEGPPIARTVKKIANRIGMPVHEAMALAGHDLDRAAEALANETLMKGLTVENGAINLSLIPPREIVQVWVYAAREMLGDATNYVEMEIKLADEAERFAFVLQRIGKLTPHEARQKAEAERDELRDLVRELSNPSPCRFDHDGGCQEHGPTSTWDGCPHARVQELLAALDLKEDQ